MNAWIFDIDGTLTDTYAVDSWAYVAAIAHVFGKSLDDSDWDRFQNVTDGGILAEFCEEQCGREPAASEVAEMKRELLARYRTAYGEDTAHFSEVPGAADFVRRCMGDARIGAGFATGAWAVSAHYKLEKIGLDPGDVAIGSSDDAHERTEIARKALARLEAAVGRSAQRLIMVGDGAWDLRTAQSLGAEFIGVDVRGNGELERLGAGCVIRDFGPDAQLTLDRFLE